jgi:DNA polymerase V
MNISSSLSPFIRETSGNKIFAVVDCDNFFVSCERVFRPDLRNKPVAVMSNNDGCIVSRSKEVKELGIPMGAPVFKYRELIENNHVQLFSGNFSLYGDMSKRVMNILKESVATTHEYSIDEAFLDFTKLAIPDNDYQTFCLNLREKIKRYTDIPVSIGIASTKTLAKIGSKLGKKGCGVVDITRLSPLELDETLKNYDISDIWGIGRKLTPKLQTRNIFTAYDFKNYDPQIIKRLISITGERTWLELNGISCIDIHSNTMVRKGIASTRGFGRLVRNLSELEEAVASYIATACEKLRGQGTIASYISVYIRTAKFKDEGKYVGYKDAKLPYPNSDTKVITKAALELLHAIYKPGYDYAKAGVFLSGMKPLDSIQENLITQDYYKKNIESRKTMKVLDSLNIKWGSGTIKLATAGTKSRWRAKSEKRSRRYTTRWNEILTAKW